MAEITDSKTRRLMKRGRKRPLKNFFWWLFGFVSSFLAFAGIAALAICVFPIRTYMGERTDEFVDEEIGSGTVLNFLLNYQNWTVSDLPFIRRILEDVVNKSPIGHYVEIDYDGLDQLRYNDFTSGHFDITEYLTVTATLNALVNDLNLDLGAFGKLEAFTDWRKVVGEIDTSATDFAPALYYYRVNVNTSGKKEPNYAFKVKEIISGSDGFSYTRAYDDNGNLKGGAVGKDLYMPALFDVPLTEAMPVFQPRFMEMQATSLLSLANIEDGVIFDMLNGYTIKGLKNFNTDDIKLTLVLPNNEKNTKLYKILKGATGVEPDSITIGDLNNNFDTNNIEIATILDSGDNEDLFNFIRSCQGLPDDHVVTVGDLNGMDIKKAELSTVLKETEDTKDLYEILRAVTGKDTKDEQGHYPPLKIEDLDKPLVFDNVKLTTVMKENDDNKELYDIVKDATDTEDASEITIGKLTNSFETDKVKVSTIIPNDANNSKLYGILEDATGKTGDDIAVGDLDGLDFDNAKISRLMTDPSDSLRDILEDGCSTIIAGYQAINYPVGGYSDWLVECTAQAIDNNDPSYLMTGSKTFEGDLFEVTINLLEGGNGTITVLKNGVVDEQLDCTWQKQDEALRVSTITVPVKDYVGKFHVTEYSDADYDTITVKQLSDFDVGNVHISSVVDNPDTLNIIVSATGVEAEDLRLRDLTSSFDMNRAKISDILDLHYDNEHEDQKTFMRILVSSCYSGSDEFDPGLTEDELIQEKYKLITVGDINNFVVKDIYLLDVIPVDSNQTFYAILADSEGVPHDNDHYKAFTIGTISDGIDFDSVHLTSVLTKNDDNEKMFDILLDGSGAADYDSITIGDLSTLDIDDVHLTSIIPEDAGNGKLYPILRDATGKANNADIVVGDLENMDLDLVHLTSFIDDDAEHATILSILSSACGVTKANLTVESLEDFDPGNIFLADVLDPTDSDNDKIYDILLDATGQTNKANITISMLSGDSFDIRNVRLSKAISSSDTGDNAILKALVEDNTVTIGNLGQKINEISLYKAYGDTVFTKTGAHAVNDKYVKSIVGGKVTYTYDPTAPEPADSNDTYYISEDSNIWLLFCYDSEDISAANGRIGRYVESDKTFADLVDGNITNRITMATIYNLIASGMITDDGYPDTLKAMTIQQVIDWAKYVF